MPNHPEDASVCHICGKRNDEPGEMYCSAAHPLPLKGAPNSGADPVCAFHGKRWSEHDGGRCLYCCICFRTLTPDECAPDENGVKWDICVPCYAAEKAAV